MAVNTAVTSTINNISKQAKRWDGWQSPSHTYVAFVEDVHDVQKGMEVVFDAVPLEFLNNTVFAYDRIEKADLPYFPSSFFVLTGIEEKQLNVLLELDDKSRIRGMDAFLLVLDDSGKDKGFLIDIYDPETGNNRGKSFITRGSLLDPRPSSLFHKTAGSTLVLSGSGTPRITSRTKRDRRGRYARVAKKVKRTRDAARPEGPAVDEAMAALLQLIHGSFVGVMDVGQANCNALFGTRVVPPGEDENEHDDNIAPRVYFDMGRPLPMPNFAATQPPGLAPCIHPDPNVTIVLSHWHYDHYQLARANIAAVANKQWIVPDQGGLGFNAHNFFQQLHNIRIWDAAAPAVMNFGWGSVGRCTGGDWNSSGLAMRIRIGAGAMLEPGITLTGDADFHFIPAALRPAHPLTEYIVAKHHGSNIPAANIAAIPLRPAGQGGIAYSYGVREDADGNFHRNPYDHPTAAAIVAYAGRNWAHPDDDGDEDEDAPNFGAATGETAPHSGIIAHGNISILHIPAGFPWCPAGHCSFRVFPAAKRL